MEALYRHIPIDLIAWIAARQAEGPKVRVLEIGCGEGRLLMELRKRFPAIELHGINREPWEVMRDRESFGETGIYYRIFEPGELEGVELPFAHFYDASRLDFEDASIDLIVSQKAIHYVVRKERLIEEAWRVLRPGGFAILQIDDRHPVMPDILAGETPRFVVHDRDGAAVPLATHLAGVRARGGFDIELYEQRIEEDNAIANRALVGHKVASVILRKNLDAPLSLGLSYDEAASFTLEVPDQPREIFWGHRSVYRSA